MVIKSEQFQTKLVKNSSAFLGFIFRLIILGGVSFVILYPLFTRTLVSLMPLEDVYDLSVNIYPKSFTLDNYIRAWNFLDMSELLPNTFLYPILISVAQTLAASVVAYGFSRFNFPLKNFLFALVIIAMVIPPDIRLLPLYLSFKSFDPFGLIQLFGGTPLNLLDTPWPFVLLGLTCTGLKNGFYVFLMHQYYRGMPKELSEAAYVDGAGFIRAFATVFLPGASQIIITVFLFSFVWQYLDSLFTSVFAQHVPMLSIELSRLLTNADSVEAGISNLAQFSLVRNAAMMFLIIPLLILYLFCQRYFTQSIERSGLVG